MDWLSRLFEMMPVRGRLDLCCSCGAPWRIDQGGAKFQVRPQLRLAAASCKSIARGAGAEARVLRARDILQGEGVTSLVVSSRRLRSITSRLCVNCLRRVGQRVGRGQPWIAIAIAAAARGCPLTLLQATEAAGHHLGSHVLAAKFTCGSGRRGREESESSERHNRRGAPFQDPFDLSRGVGRGVGRGFQRESNRTGHGDTPWFVMSNDCGVTV